ncbi:NYN domain-containing protein [Citricoccus parietis]|uniref:NYN domain-containing protein n=1 Tax=Citricoccus parietis TaxID=592307 RepID=A0ABV5G628_9MICC
MALLEAVADIPWIAERYRRVVIASGDHAFTFAVASLRAAGVEVIVIRPDIGFSSALRRAAGPNVVSLGSRPPANVVNLFTHTKDAA